MPVEDPDNVDYVPSVFVYNKVDEVKKAKKEEQANRRKEEENGARI